LGTGFTPHHDVTLDLFCADSMKAGFGHVDPRGYVLRD
jgi:hypothetical protein